MGLRKRTQASHPDIAPSIIPKDNPSFDPSENNVMFRISVKERSEVFDFEEKVNFTTSQPPVPPAIYQAREVLMKISEEEQPIFFIIVFL